MSALVTAAEWAAVHGAHRSMIVLSDPAGCRVSLCRLGRELGVGVGATPEEASAAALREAGAG